MRSAARYARKEAGQKKERYLRPMYLPRSTHLGVLSCEQRCRTSHCALHSSRGILGKPALDNLLFSSRAHLQTPLRGLCMPQSLGLVDFFLIARCYAGANKPYDGRLYACQLHFWPSTCHVRPSTLALQSQIYLVKMQYMPSMSYDSRRDVAALGRISTTPAVRRPS